jgi:hypothetical protein
VPRVDPTIKAAALADLHSGEQPAVVAEKYRLKRSTVKSWVARADASAVASTRTAVASVPAPIVRPTVEAQQRQIGELVLDLLRAKLEASATIARLVSTAELVSLGNYLDDTALSLGDRLAGAGRPTQPDEPDRADDA